MPRRRVHVLELSSGRLVLGKSEAHHVRDVLRMKVDEELELFNDAGAQASARITRCDAGTVEVEVGEMQFSKNRTELIVASAIPKGERADWMIEKLSELGVTRFIPLIAARSVVVPSGKNKLDRWRRIATESAKQSKRAGVMAIDDPREMGNALAGSVGWALPTSSHEGGQCPPYTNRQAALFYLSTEPSAPSIFSATTRDVFREIVLFIGPEGGWTEEEITLFARHNLTPARLTATILRVETAAVAAAAIAATFISQKEPESP